MDEAEMDVQAAESAAPWEVSYGADPVARVVADRRYNRRRRPSHGWIWPLPEYWMAYIERQKGAHRR